MAKRALGKGLDALISNEKTEDSGIKELKINEIEPNINQPRKRFDDEKLQQLAESIKQHGIVQPIIVSNEDNTYRIVAGERRWRAARLAGITTVPVIIKNVSKREEMELALIENLQREDLNPIEEAEAYEKLIREHGITQEELSGIIGKSRPAITNSLRLLSLDEKVKGYLINEEISSGHARALLAIEDKELQKKAADEVISMKLSVRETEKLVKKYLDSKKQKVRSKSKSAEHIEIEERLKEIFGTKVKLVTNNKKGKIMIEYYSNDELERIMELFYNIPKISGL
ncbi:chromosome partitioning protein ParB [Clostridium thermosuccinogenes]|uniref:Chromosome partitioning protein ParB n=1 Tax=Clostridium thermosuccinogenes TaxID=84032 RepID=A0A2K2FJN4_9CLOT|nr:ParB/RepB/Spo0J family partition protein [Pseudoclostridium thermosuccinogenes]AUS98490.1 chromosome partitioning protein ParB [Pseudoclostridium thermosuccinogenes]PNT90845.1 chromosome partitioning protein ParB [Pseudoclostridium thermosuccinogenes]PNT97057.1 chromosome partitioning protein ParB [Pseudoclostridium thermosuccinogenes]PNT98988.1 chromosome partitioning protein ParB [Pseudoclostridium thermosuccinogenes]